MDLQEETKQNLRRLIERLKTLDVQSVISYWINSEIEEAEMYNFLASIVREYSWDTRVEKLFLELAHESLDHAEALLREYRRLYPGSPLRRVELPSIEVEFSKTELEEKIRSGRLEDVILALIESEKFARDTYRYLEQHSPRDLKKLFHDLARIEEGHYTRLKNLLEGLQHK
ncbi:ferritin-like domain-containing protein [Thermococcus sp.]